jgi:shikimate kinase
VEAVNLTLTGFMATGKSVVGRIVARRLGMRFVDMDTVIEERAGKPISRIFAEDGEPVFRQMEADLARELSAEDGVVIATGGGCMLRPENREALGQASVVVCLWADPEEVLRRAGEDSSRPLLPGGGAEEIRQLLAQRQPAYQQLPNHIHTTGMTKEQVAEQVIEIIQSRATSRDVSPSTPSTV